jgi:hypothetical protein
MLLEILSDYIYVEFKRFLIACIPYYEMELSERFMVLNLLFYNIDISFMIVLTPNLIEYRLSTCGYFFEFILLNVYLNIFAF